MIYTLWRLWRNNWGWDWGWGHLLLGLTTPWGSNLLGSRWRRGRTRGRLVFLFIRIINNTPSASTHRQRGHNFYHLKKKNQWFHVKNIEYLNNSALFLRTLNRSFGPWGGKATLWVLCLRKSIFFKWVQFNLMLITFFNPCKCCWYVLTCIFNFFNVLAVIWMQITRFLLLYLPIGNYTKVLAKNVL